MERLGKVLIIGLDGATWKVLNPLIEMGRLPNIQCLVEHGVLGTLESVFPPVTGPAWLSMATGKNPGKTGIFDFLNRRNDALSAESVNSGHFIKNRTYWDYLSAQGFRVGILNHPMLFPPYPINGFMVSGLGASSETQITYPLELKEKLNHVTGGYELVISWNNPRYYDNKELFIEDLKKILIKKIKAAEYCLRNHELDLALIIFQESDILQHCMWEDWEDCDSEFHKEFVNYWELLDEAVGRVVDSAGNNSTVMVVSDHGFGPLNENFLINKWLVKEGYLVKTNRISGNLKDMIRRGGKPLKKTIRYIFPSFSERMSAKLRESLGDEVLNSIDMEKSTAFAAGYTSSAHGAIYIQKDNVKNYENIRQEIISRLEKFSSSQGFSLKCFRAEDLYWGENIKYAPDILLVIDNHRCNIQTNKSHGPIFSSSIPIKNKSGSHRKEGIFICSGPTVKQSKHISRAKLLDIAPTVLYLFGFEYPSSMDGRILEEIFKELPNERKQLELLEESKDAREPLGKGEQITKVEEQEIRKRLRDLGYL